MPLTIYGASDDLIEIEGDIEEEFNALDVEDMSCVLALSNGVLLSVGYSTEGVWRIDPLRGTGRVHIEKAPADDDNNYSDRVTIDDPIEWVAFASQHARKKG